MSEIGRQQSDQEILQSSYSWGEYHRERGEGFKPLTYLGWVIQYHAPGCSESFYEQVLEWYKAGYHDLKIIPAHFQR